MTKEINSLVLAYLGDTIYEDYIREFLIKSGIANVNDLQTASIKYSSAKAQSEIVKNANKNFKNSFHSISRPKKTFRFTF